MSQAATHERPNRALKIAFFILTLLVSVPLVLWLLSVTDRRAVWGSVKNADPMLLALAGFGSLAVNAVFASDRWRIILGGLGIRLSLPQVVKIEMGCSPLKVFLPFKSGELVKAYAVARLGGVHFEQIIGSKLMDKYLVAVGLTVVLIIGAMISAQWIIAASGFVALIILLALLSPMARKPLWILAGAVNPRVERLVRRLLSSFEGLQPSTILYLCIHSVSYNFLIVAYLALCFMAVGVHAPAGTMITSLVFLQLAGLFPASFSGLGVRESAAMILLAGYGAPATLLAGALCATLIDQFLFPITGLIFFQGFMSDMLKRDRQ